MLLLGQRWLKITHCAVNKVPDNTTASLYLCHLFSMLSLIMLSAYLCTRMYLNTIALSTDGTIVNMCPCLLLVVICAVCQWPGVFYYWYACIWILCNYRCICVNINVLTISLHPPSSNVVKCSFCIPVLCLSDDTVSDYLWMSLIYSCVYLCKLCQVLIDLSYVMTGKICVDINMSVWWMSSCPDKNKVPVIHWWKPPILINVTVS